MILLQFMNDIIIVSICGSFTRDIALSRVDSSKYNRNVHLNECVELQKALNVLMCCFRKGDYLLIFSENRHKFTNGVELNNG